MRVWSSRRLACIFFLPASVLAHGAPGPAAISLVYASNDSRVFTSRCDDAEPLKLARHVSPSQRSMVHCAPAVSPSRRGQSLGPSIPSAVGVACPSIAGEMAVVALSFFIMIAR